MFLSRFVLVELNLRRLALPLAIAFAQALGAIGLGRGVQVALARVFRWEGEETPRIRVDFLAGYPLFGALCFLVALVSSSKLIMSLVLLGGLVGGAYSLRRYMRRADTVEWTPESWVAMAVIVLAVAGGIAVAQLPAVTLDEVAYHLAVLRIWVQEGRAVELPLLSHSYFPFGIESADLPALSLLGRDGAVASHFLHLFAALATGLLIYSWLRRRVSGEIALVGTAAVITTPALLVTAGWSWNEWPLVGLCIALLASVDQANVNRATVAALIAGGLMTKYSFPLFALGVLIGRRDRSLVKPVLVGALLGSVFFVRNLILTGNPLAPFLGQLSPQIGRYRGDLAGYIFDGGFLDESLGIAVIALPLALLAALPSERPLRHVTIALAIATVLVLLGRPSSRLLLPFLIALATIAIVALETILPRRMLSWGLIAAALLQLFLTLVYLSRLQPFDLLTGRRSDTEYAAEQRQPLGTVLWIDAQLPPDSRTLVLGVNELFWFSHRVRGGGNFDSNRIAAYLREISKRVQIDGITHVAVAGDGLRVGSLPQSKKEQERVTTIDPAAAISLREFLKSRGRPIASRGNTAVYAIGTPASPAAPASPD